MRKMHPLQQLDHPRAPLALRAVKTERNVLGHAEMRKEREILEHEPDPPPLGRDAEDRVAHQRAIDMDLARVLHLDARDHAQRRGLATTRRPQQAHHLTRHDLQGHVVDHKPPIVAAGDIADLKPGGGALHRCLSFSV